MPAFPPAAPPSSPKGTSFRNSPLRTKRPAINRLALQSTTALVDRDRDSLLIA
jgi:hypothetical protein